MNLQLMFFQKALSEGNENQKKSIIKEIVKQDGQTKDHLLIAADDKFGNHFVQIVYEKSDEENRNNIYNRIKSSPFLKNENSYTKYVLYKIENKLNEKHQGGDKGKIARKKRY